MAWFSRRTKAAETESRHQSVEDWPLLHLPTGDVWTARDSFSGSLVTGATGAGKTSGPGQNLALAMLEAGWGGLVLTAKTDEAAIWRDYAKCAGREDELIVIDDTAIHRFNFMHHAVTVAPTPHILTLNLVGLYGSIMEAINGTAEVLEDYWTHARDQLLTNAFDAILPAYGTVDLQIVDKLILSAPTSVDQLHDETWQNESACMETLKRAFDNIRQDDPIRRRSLDQSAAYFLNEYPKLPDRTRSSIVSTFRSASDLLNRGLLWKLFATDTTYVPEVCRNGAIIILDLPVHTHQKAGIIAQVLFKYVWQQAMQRPSGGEERPVFLWCDEYHHFAVQADATFQSTARAYRIATVYMFQNLPILHAALGGQQAEPYVNAILGNLATRFFTANAEPQTNHWASETIGHTIQRLHSASSSTNRQEESLTNWLITGEDTASFTSQSGYSEQMLPQVQPQVFTRLRTGGPANNCEVDAIMFQTGRTFRNGRTFVTVAFPQNI